METLLGNYLTAVSVIIVYHLFSLQHWLGQVTDLESEAVELKRATGIGDISRERLRARCARTSKQFPWIQVILLFMAVTIVCYLALRVAWAIPAIRRLYSMGPTVVLWLVFVAASVSAWQQGRRLLNKVTSGL